jgi:CheY-like chemotaxis protein
MPRLNGIQTVEKIREFIKERNVIQVDKIIEPKFVFLTAHKTSAFDRHLRNMGVHAVFEKPLRIFQLEGIFRD